MISESLSIETIRYQANQQMDPARKSELGQFMTPARIADFMASLFSPRKWEAIRLLDAGAGIGSLTAGFLEHWFQEHVASPAIEVTAYEIDATLHHYLREVLDHYCLRAQQKGWQFTLT